MKHKLKLFSQPLYPEHEQYIDFVQRELRTEEKALVTIKNGTTIRSVLKVCLTELEGLQEKLPCRENFRAMENINQAIDWLDEREKDRKKRGVEGFHLL